MGEVEGLHLRWRSPRADDLIANHESYEYGGRSSGAPTRSGQGLAAAILARLGSLETVALVVRRS